MSFSEDEEDSLSTRSDDVAGVFVFLFGAGQRVLARGELCRE